MAALLGREVVTRDCRTVRIRIAFHPGERCFEVSNPAIEKSPAGVPTSPPLQTRKAEWRDWHLALPASPVLFRLTL